MKVLLFLRVKLSLSLINKILYVILSLVFSSIAYSDSYVKAGDTLIWDSGNKNYTAEGNVEFKNKKFIAYCDKMIANYIEENNKEVFTVVELFENVVIEFKDEIFRGNHAIYTKDDNTIILTGNVSIESPTRLLTGNELIADIDNNKRILNSADKDSLVEVLLENNAKD